MNLKPVFGRPQDAFIPSSARAAARAQGREGQAEAARLFQGVRETRRCDVFVRARARSAARGRTDRGRLFWTHLVTLLGVGSLQLGHGGRRLHC